MAEYRDLYPSIRAAGANVLAASVDAPGKSEAVRRQLRLPFPILSDSARRVIQEWAIYNPREQGGIAKPAVFILAPDCTVRFVSVDPMPSRVPAAEILRRLTAQSDGTPAVRKTIFPGPATFFRAFRNGIRSGVKQRKE